MKKRSVTIAGHSTSITLEDAFWSALKTVAERDNLSLNKLITHIDDTRKNTDNLSSAIRIYILNDLQKQLASH